MTTLIESKALRLFCVAIFLLHVAPLPALAEDEDDLFVTNVRVERQGRINIFIEYDLEGSSSDLYTVTLTVKSKTDSLYSYTPINVIGDVGANIRPGKNKRISWRISDEFPPVLGTPDAQFVVRAIPPKREGGSTELYVAGGAALLGVALAIVFLSSNKADATQTNNVFPNPPGRP